MIIGLPKETKDNEYRVAMTPAGVGQLTAAGHKIIVQAGAGEGSGISDGAYRAAGAVLASSPEEVWSQAELIVKVKEPIQSECRFLRPGLTVFTYLHLAGVPGLAGQMVKSGATAIAYETVELANGTFPLLAPMSEIAGRLAILAGAHYLQRAAGGPGKLIGGIPGVPAAKVAIIGAGVVGHNAARLAMACGASVTLLDRNTEKLRQFVAYGYPGSEQTLAATTAAMADAVASADLVIGAVYVGGMKAAHVVTREMVRAMKPRSVIVDVSIDQGGCVETSHPTTYSDPVFTEEGVVHYCVANMPGAVPQTATLALTNATLPYVAAIASKGVAAAARDDSSLASGVNVYRGTLVSEAVGRSVGITATPLALAMN
ncbi:MAG: alanine dehydrogenase [Dehalococcoidia bacterium]|nr:alanine dehydrogenase [Dehalococcoidia bacterium]